MNRGTSRLIVGIDEAGRGPLAGPVSVGVAVVPADFDWGLLPKVGDSKKVSAKDREAVFQRARELKQEGMLDYAVSMASASIIDRYGITSAVTRAMGKALSTLDLNPDEVDVKLDGLLKAPPAFRVQETIIKGDSKELVIGLASILAKVTRDRYMARLGLKYAPYGLEIHKGYGTRMHREAILLHGLSPVHRTTFCTRLRK